MMAVAREYIQTERQAQRHIMDDDWEHSAFWIGRHYAIVSLGDKSFEWDSWQAAIRAAREELDDPAHHAVWETYRHDVLGATD
jgi:hypothetical protein